MTARSFGASSHALRESFAHASRHALSLCHLDLCDGSDGFFVFCVCDELCVCHEFVLARGWGSVCTDWGSLLCTDCVAQMFCTARVCAMMGIAHTVRYAYHPPQLYIRILHKPKITFRAHNHIYTSSINNLQISKVNLFLPLYCNVFIGHSIAHSLNVFIAFL